MDEVIKIRPLHCRYCDTETNTMSIALDIPVCIDCVFENPDYDNKFNENAGLTVD